MNNDTNLYTSINEALAQVYESAGKFDVGDRVKINKPNDTFSGENGTIKTKGRGRVNIQYRVKPDSHKASFL